MLLQSNRSDAKKLMRNVTLESGRVLLKNNYIYFSRGQMSELMRFDLGAEESFAIMYKDTFFSHL